MDYIQILTSNAECQLGVEQWEQAHSSVADAKAKLIELNVSPLNEMADVITFVSHITNELDDISSSIISNYQNMEVRDKIEYINTIKWVAVKHMNQEQWDQALEKVEEVRTKLSELNAAPLNNKDKVMVFLQDTLLSLDKLVQEVYMGKYSKDAKNKIEYLGTLHTTATQNLKVEQWDQATDKIEDARKRISELDVTPYNTLPAVVAFLKEYPPTLDKLSEDIIAAKFGKDAKKEEYLDAIRTIAAQTVNNSHE
jgi:hypothetical protein